LSNASHFHPTKAFVTIINQSKNSLPMSRPTVLIPAEASRVVQDDQTVVLVGQPPEILKNLLLNNIMHFDAMLLTDIKEKDGSLLNNLEFPFYFFVFVAKGLAEGRKIKLVGEEPEISHALRLLRLTLMGPTRAELDGWNTDNALKEEWLAISKALAVPDSSGAPKPIEDFFETIPFESGRARVGTLQIDHTGRDKYKFSNSQGSIQCDLPHDIIVKAPYSIKSDYVPGGLVKLGIEVLGGASGFSVNEPCTGLALCYNGDYMLIDSIPFLDDHLYARGISKNQVSAVFLTHLHDDHCAMFPLMRMPHRVEVISTKEIYEMAMDKLSCQLGWSKEVISEHFTLNEVTPGKTLNYFGLIIDPHLTVHSIPTIGATFTIRDKDGSRRLCIIGDNDSLASIRRLHEAGHVRTETLQNIERLFSDNFHMLFADGGAGAIHGNPADALASEAERIVFVHVDDLPAEFSNIFSLASSGKRYTVFEGDKSIYTSQVSHYLSSWLGKPFPNRWMRSLLAQEEIRRYNADDVIVVQDADSRGFVYLVLTGYCSVVQHDGTQSRTIAQLQAGDLIGEMAVVTGAGNRNASVVASSPVTICVFSEDTFVAFIENEGFKPDLLRRWALRPIIRLLPQFASLSSSSLEIIGRYSFSMTLAAGESLMLDHGSWYVFAKGELVSGDPIGTEYGDKPLSQPNTKSVTASQDSTFLCLTTEEAEKVRLEIPQLNYELRKYRVNESDPDVDWILGILPVN
jgi:CRP-like cAMP-binding protein